MKNICQNLQQVRELVRQYEAEFSRPMGSVCLIAASKNQPLERILTAYACGQLHFGESYLQEALSKIIQAPPEIQWHFIGPIQSNKTRKIATHFSWVQSVADIKVAKRLNDQRPPELPPLNILIQINVSEDPNKAGALLEDANELAFYCASLPRLHLRGLMTIPAPHADFAKQRQEFHKLFKLWEFFRNKGLYLDTLSMGMSSDFKAAIAEGATMIRVGTNIFGKRSKGNS